jgi:heptosyltransferase-2
MATPAIENILSHFPNYEIFIVGSFVSTELFANHPRVKTTFIDNTKKSKCKLKAIYQLSKEIGKVDIGVSFRSSFRSKVLMYFCAKKRFYFSKHYQNIHQVEKYNSFINDSFNISTVPQDLKLYFEKKIFTKPTLGINPGATYGSAKRWYPTEFAKVCIELSNNYDILIFGGPSEQDIAKDIEDELKQAGVTNYTNLAGETTIKELVENIARLSLFITNDSGPMHIGAAFKVPTIAIFGPTKDFETNQWNNPNGVIVKADLECMPCMKRVCPLKTHECMKKITSKDVLSAKEKVKTL